jgi:molecular chaperone IbpA
MITTTYSNKVMELFNDPFLIGFSREFDRLNAIQKTNSKVAYPPYNVLQYGEDSYALELAVAGFKSDEIDVTVKDGSLIVSGEKLQVENDDYFLYRGIATRKFTRSFALAEFMEVEKADIQDGILSITINRVVPEEKKPRQIEIIDHSANNKFKKLK